MSDAFKRPFSNSTNPVHNTNDDTDSDLPDLTDMDASASRPSRHSAYFGYPNIPGHPETPSERRDRLNFELGHPTSSDSDRAKREIALMGPITFRPLEPSMNRNQSRLNTPQPMQSQNNNTGVTESGRNMPADLARFLGITQNVVQENAATPSKVSHCTSVMQQRSSIINAGRLMRAPPKIAMGRNPIARENPFKQLNVTSNVSQAGNVLPCHPIRVIPEDDLRPGCDPPKLRSSEDCQGSPSLLRQDVSLDVESVEEKERPPPNLEPEKENCQNAADEEDQENAQPSSRPVLEKLRFVNAFGIIEEWDFHQEEQIQSADQENSIKPPNINVSPSPEIQPVTPCGLRTEGSTRPDSPKKQTISRSEPEKLVFINDSGVLEEHIIQQEEKEDRWDYLLEESDVDDEASDADDELPLSDDTE